MTKAKNRNINKKRNIIIYILAGVIILVGFILFRSFYINNTIYQPDTNSYTSKTMKLTVEIPKSYEIEDNQISINLKKNNYLMTIVVNGTNYSNLDDYLANFDSRRDIRNIDISDASQFKIDGYDAVSRIVNFPDENLTQKSYYIFANSAIYIFSTSSPELYSDLDRIARSFRYTP